VGRFRGVLSAGSIFLDVLGSMGGNEGLTCHRVSKGINDWSRDIKLLCSLLNGGDVRFEMLQRGQGLDNRVHEAIGSRDVDQPCVVVLPIVHSINDHLFLLFVFPSGRLSMFPRLPLPIAGLAPAIRVDLVLAPAPPMSLSLPILPLWIGQTQSEIPKHPSRKILPKSTKLRCKE
jgi:hypothetical protein